MTKYYNEVSPSPDFTKLETEIQAYWQQNNIFDASIRGDKEFVFYDGPPFANGLPHYGHLLSGFIKDLFGRYQTMKGKKVERRFGWDCHGLPAEMLAEKELGISGKKQIEEFGIEKFNAYCRSSVLQYANEWKYYVTRQGRWVDFVHDYKTMDTPYMESVIWAFKTLYDQGLIYQSMRVMPYSWACETPVSDFETRMDNAYREKKSKSVVVSFKLNQPPRGVSAPIQNCYILAWTTTPWTLPSNLALAVGADIEYAIIRHGDKDYIIAVDLAEKYQGEVGSDIVARCYGRDLVGISYPPLFPYFSSHPNSFVILAGDFVTTEDGTGIVHMAPGFGEDDQKLCEQNGIELVCPVDNSGKFTEQVPDFVERQVFDANDDIIIYLKKHGSWLKTEQYLHNYPHCWRTDTSLIYKAVPSWYLKVTSIKDKMLANNQQINWIPSHIRDGLFGKWLENARDWSISRSRYWGCPIPIWQSDDPRYPHIEVYGSIAELEQAFCVKVSDLHKPFIDTLVRQNPSDPTGKSMLRRVPEVLDCWFESGSMPYAQVHYPFENKERFETHFPADFIVEYVAQTRGWFYTMMVLATALFDRPPFLNCICHGVILGDGGQKLSKRLKNYADPQEVFDTIGSDAMRWFMISSQVMKGQEIVIDHKATGMKEALRSVVKPLWNTYNFFVLYANIDGIDAKFDSSCCDGFLGYGDSDRRIDSNIKAYQNVLDRYIMSKCLQACSIVEKSLDEYDTISATRVIDELIEVLNNWYIRRSRERFWRNEKDEDKIQAYNTLFTVLCLICRMAAPLMPMITEQIYRGLTKEKSVHLESFPSVVNRFKDQNGIDGSELITSMERVREACNAALHIRNEVGIRVRQPLQKVTFVGVSDSASLSADMQRLVLDEINVKEWENLDVVDIDKFAERVLQLNLQTLGKRIPHKTKELIIASKKGEWRLSDDGLVVIAGETLAKDEFEFKLKPKEFVAKNSCALRDSLVILDLAISNELLEEGVARDLVRSIQQARKDMGLEIMDHIQVEIYQLAIDTPRLNAVLVNWRKYICEQTLSDGVSGVIFNDATFDEITQNKHRCRIEIEGCGLVYIVVCKADAAQ